MSFAMLPLDENGAQPDTPSSPPITPHTSPSLCVCCQRIGLGPKKRKKKKIEHGKSRRVYV